MKSLTGNERCEEQRAAAELLCKRLGYLPLGLELVGRYLHGKPDLPLQEMLSRLQSKGLDHRATDLPTGPTTAERGVAAAFELSWDELTQPAKDLGCLLSLFALAPIPWEIVQRCFPDTDAEEIEDQRDASLMDASLLQRKGESGR